MAVEFRVVLLAEWLVAEAGFACHHDAIPACIAAFGIGVAAFSLQAELTGPCVILRPLLLALAVALGGCTRTIAVMQPRAAIPADMLICPPPPDLRRARTDADVAQGIVALSETDRACRARLAATRTALDTGH